MGNLISTQRGFRWEDSSVDRGQLIQNLNSALVRAKKEGDQLFRSADFYDNVLPWGNLVHVIYSSPYHSEQRKQLFPWLTQIQHQTLFHLLGLLATATPKNANSIEELDSEFYGENNGECGCYFPQFPNGFVHDMASWEEFHRSFVKDNPAIKKTDADYYYKFYSPELQTEARIIRDIIAKRRHPFLKRLDVPQQEDGKMVHGQQVHIHFNDDDNSALNIDGSWKHGKCKLPTDICELLREWGFKIH